MENNTFITGVVNANLGRVLYDVAYTIIMEVNVTKRLYSTDMPLGNPGFWGLYDETYSLENSLVSRIIQYYDYLTTMFNNADFTDYER